jgi:hypothetical protein
MTLDRQTAIPELLDRRGPLLSAYWKSELTLPVCVCVCVRWIFVCALR